MDDIDHAITTRVPGIKFDTHELLDDMIGDMVGRRQPVVIQLTRRIRTCSTALPSRLRKRSPRSGGAAGVRRFGSDSAGDALEIHVDADAAATQA